MAVKQLDKVAEPPASGKREVQLVAAIQRGSNGRRAKALKLAACIWILVISDTGMLLAAGSSGFAARRRPNEEGTKGQTQGRKRTRPAASEKHSAEESSQHTTYNLTQAMPPCWRLSCHLDDRWRLHCVHGAVQQSLV